MYVSEAIFWQNSCRFDGVVSAAHQMIQKLIENVVNLLLLTRATHHCQSQFQYAYARMSLMQLENINVCLVI